MDHSNAVLIKDLFQNINDIFSDSESFNVKDLNKIVTKLTERWNVAGKESTDILKVIKKSIQSLVEHCQIEHQNYIKIVNKVTENSNVAIRNAIQYGQHDNLISLNKIQEKCDIEKEKYMKAQRDKFDEYEYQINHVKRENSRLENEKNELLDKLSKYTQDKNEAVDKALIEQK